MNLPNSVGICFGQFGPYHHARVLSFQKTAKECGITVIPIQIASRTFTYDWEVDDGSPRCEGLKTLCQGTDDTASPLQVYLRARRLLSNEKVRLLFVPSYWPPRVLALFLAARSLGISTVMMCDSHSGTEQARGWKKYFKGVIIRGFDAALVGGKPHERYFESFGMPREYIFTGYDAVDNEYYSRRSADVRDCTAPSRSRPFDLPSRYFLSLGRMVQKKNLPILIEGYEGYVRRCHSADIRPAALVLVGSGEEEPRLRALARTSGLRVVDFTQKSIGSAETSHISGTDNSECGGLVYFYGFRQIAENVVFYALAEAFVLPSTSEEWGLVVNEAMACSLPVVVSRNAGCVEDLVLPRTDGSTPRLLSAVRDEPFGRNLLDERSNGFVFEPTCAEALAEALWSITRADQKDISELGKRSREIVDQYSCENFGRQALLAAIAALRLPAGKPSQTHQRL